MRVLALKDGTIGKGPAVRRVRAGEVFDLPDDHPLGKWMEKVKDEPKAQKVEGKAPKTLSEITKASTKASAPKGAEGLV